MNGRLYDVDLAGDDLKFFKDRDAFLKELKDSGFLYAPDHSMFIKNFHDKNDRQLVFRFYIDFKHFGEMNGYGVFIEHKDGALKEIKRWETRPMCDYDIMTGECLMSAALRMIREANKFTQRWFSMEKKIALRNEAENALKEQDG